VSDPLVRRAREGDLPELVAIYNHYVEHTAITFDLKTYTVDERREWWAQFAARGRHQLFVAEQQGKVLGYAGTHRFRAKAAYDPSVEMTIYLAPGAVGRGTGARLYAALFDALRGEDVHRAYAGITLPNEASIALHRRFGFGDVGLFHEVGRKFDRWWDVTWLEKPLGDGL
jgi:phosphinothricin acetyltransferase